MSPFIQINAGVWRQVEIHLHPNTGTPTTGTDCNSMNGGTYCHGNGVAELFLNGSLTVQVKNRNLNGTQTLSGQIGKAEIGGTLTDFCSPANGGGYAVPFSRCQSDAPTPFHRYIADLIIITK